MIFLILSIICSTFIFVVFKLIAKNNINILQAIVINYTVCVLTGIIAQNDIPSLSLLILRPWFINSIFMGILFITIFNITAFTVRVSGVAVTSIFNKLSLIIPVTVAYFLYDDDFSTFKIIGIIIAVIAIIFTTYKSEPHNFKRNFKYYFLPVIVLVGSGLIETFTKLNQYYFVQHDEFNLFLIAIFGSAAIIGWVLVIFRYFYYKEKIAVKSLGYGLLLGVPNYGSIYFLIVLLDLPNWDSSTVFPVNNISIVVATCLVAMFVFKERMNKINITGIGLAIIAILFLM